MSGKTATYVTVKSQVATATENLSRKKDRVQATSCSALSVSLVVILKTIIDSGPDGFQYYAFNLTLVLGSMVLQVVTGILLLVMNLTSAKISRLNPPETHDALKVIAATYKYGSMDTGDYPMGVSGLLSKKEDDNAADLERVDQKYLIELLTKKIRKQFDQLSKAQYQLSAMDADKTDEIKKVKKQVNKYKRMIDLTVHQLRLALIVEHVEKKMMYIARMTLFQNSITYILYATFIFNTFLIGFGTLESYLYPPSMAPTHLPRD